MCGILGVEMLLLAHERTRVRLATMRCRCRGERCGRFGDGMVVNWRVVRSRMSHTRPATSMRTTHSCARRIEAGGLKNVRVVWLCVCVSMMGCNSVACARACWHPTMCVLVGGARARGASESLYRIITFNKLCQDVYSLGVCARRAVRTLRLLLCATHTRDACHPCHKLNYGLMHSVKLDAIVLNK